MKILNITQKSWQDKIFFDIEVETNEGNIKGSYWGKDELAIGQEVDFEIVKNDKGYITFKNKNSKSGNSMIKGMMENKQKAIEKSMDKKNIFINNTLDRKELSIHLVSSQRDATMITCALIDKGTYKTPVEIKKANEEWRQYFLNSYMKNIDDFSPFN